MLFKEPVKPEKLWGCFPSVMVLLVTDEANERNV